ncbi:hypothetical protein KC19_2G272700 [Ceratodon purpureus]|uniref:Uncharacterized protein n=1 Tax=Ceratodon purpureus TaxID=3225 RepID=A0A8T0J0W2_CERPU|nr:hypothetical protein KC19_2G272700 [Ceratodon purpureus]
MCLQKDSSKSMIHQQIEAINRSKLTSCNKLLDLVSLDLVFDSSTRRA